MAPSDFAAFGGGGLLSFLSARAVHPSARHYLDGASLLMRHLSCSNDSVHALSDPFERAPAPSFNVRYHPDARSGSMMQVAGTANSGALLVATDEDGWISFLHADTPAADQIASVRHRFHAHNNAIFDFAWLDCNGSATHSGSVVPLSERTGAATTALVTVSGDQSARGFDIETQANLFTLTQHQGSVKTVRVQPGQPSQSIRTDTLVRCSELIVAMTG
jgi:hypothetical protein